MIQGYSIYTYATVEEAGIAYYCYLAEPLDHKPEKYWVLTDPDPYILEAIQHPGIWTESFDPENSTFWFTAIWDDPNAPPEPHPMEPVPFLYNGTYYWYGATYPGERLRVTIVNNKPEDYWNLTEPDKYLLEAIENPGKWIVVGLNSTTREILSKHIWPTHEPFFQYNGTYYTFDFANVDYGYPFPESSQTEVIRNALTATCIVVGSTAGSVYILKKRKTRTQP
jgi:hypothetical protein